MAKLIAGNWKMNGDSAAAQALAGEIAAGFRPTPAAGMVLCPPFPYLAMVGAALANSGIALGGQDCSPAASGAFTGDTAPGMLVDLGCSHVIIGHSERRHGHGEGDGVALAKTRAALAAGLTVILCIGETESEREAGRAQSVVAEQLTGSLPAEADRSQIVLAYEPVWAIGTGKVATLDDIAAMHGFIVSHLPGVPVLYGGSVKPDNAPDILALEDVHGVLVGGASLKAADFLAIAKSAPAA